MSSRAIEPCGGGGEFFCLAWGDGVKLLVVAAVEYAQQHGTAAHGGELDIKVVHTQKAARSLKT